MLFAAAGMVNGQVTYLDRTGTVSVKQVPISSRGCGSASLYCGSDSAFQFNADPAFHFNADPDPDFHFHVDPDPLRGWKSATADL